MCVMSIHDDDDEVDEERDGVWSERDDCCRLASDIEVISRWCGSVELQPI